MRFLFVQMVARNDDCAGFMVIFVEKRFSFSQRNI